MFTNSGMMQFVPYFLGEEPVPFSPRRATTVQKCVRAGGKHNDLDAIGRSPRHLSFFEMLGNFSFGDYFKRDAITWAWEFVTGRLGVDPDRIWVTVHLSDDEAEDIWHKTVGLPLERIQRLDKDNFWEMGDTGPCGPSSELFYDFGPEHGPDGGPANPEAEHRYVEFWNLVFMQYFRDASGNLSPLPNKHVDTGAGLERIVGMLRGSASLFACDTLEDLIAEAESLTGKKIGENEQHDIALRLLADHARSMTFLIADGVIPSNEDRGYVLRRIIRRAVRFAYLLGVDSHVTAAMARRAISLMGAEYPEIVAQQDLITRVLDREESQFRGTLRTGLAMLETELDASAGAPLGGAVAFTLHDTYGFPIEVTTEIAADRGLTVDLDEFARLMTGQRTRARAARKRGGVAADDRQGAYREIAESFGLTQFVGRDEYSATARVLATVPSGDQVEVFLDRTPFYAEGGGQVGDEGTLTRLSDGAVFPVRDTQHAIPGLHAHLTQAADTSVRPLAENDEVTAAIDAARREAIRRNHTGTHLLHWALREVLGAHVKQQGSLVAPDRLRFDFSHFEAITPDQLRQIEDLVNREILANGGVRHYETSQDEALAKGAMAFFGDKYGDVVRVLEAGEHSIELCGGTHVNALGQIGSLKVVSEGSVGSNLRRIEAVTGLGTLKLLREGDAKIVELAELLGSPPGQVDVAVRKRLGDIKTAQDTIRRLQQQLESTLIDELVEKARRSPLVELVDGVADANALRRVALAVRTRSDANAVVLGTVTSSGSPSVVATVSPRSGLDAGKLLDPVSALLGGGHGKQKDTAIAGGRDAGRIKEALQAVEIILR
jgi:alanyl-tRNA synthetase